jgi:hypothetical protein
MARDFRGIPFSTLPEPTDPDFIFRLRNMFSEIDLWARDVSFGMGRISRGEVPDGSGDPLPGGAIDIPNDVGAVLFVGDGPILDTDGDVFFWDTGQNLLAIGHNTPAARLHLDLSTSVNAVPSSTISGGDIAGSEWSSSSAGAMSTGSVPDASVDIDEGFPATDGDFIRSNGTPNGGDSRCVFGLSSTIPLGEGTYTVTYRASKDTTGNPAPTFRIQLYRADGDGEITADLFSSLTTSLTTYSVDIPITASPSLSGGTPNSIAFQCSGDPRERVLISAVTVTAGTAGIDLLRWDANAIESGRISDVGHMGIGTGSNALNPMLTVNADGSTTVGELIKAATSQTANLLEFRNSSDTLLSRVTSAGVWDGPITTTGAVAVTDSTFSILDDATPTKIAKFQCSGLSVGTRTFTFPDGNGTLLTDTTNHTILGAWTMQSDSASFYTPKIVVGGGGVVNGYGFALDDGSGFIGEIQTDTQLTADRFWAFPDASGVVIISGALSTLAGNTSSTFRCSTATTGASFQDQTTSTKRLRFITSGSSASTNNAISVVSTASRTYTLGDVTAGIPLLGIAASASGTLGRIVLTGQNGSLAAQTLLTGTTVSAGLYRVSFYLKTTTAGDAADNVTATLAWNDGTAQTEVIGFLGTTSNIAPYTNHDLATNNAFSHADVVVRVAASQNITFTTTLTSPGAGTPVYTIDARLEYLG